MRPPTLPLPVVLVLLLIPTLLLTVPLLRPPYPLSTKAQGCRMSWMSPSYHLVPVPGVPRSLGGRYRLWLYREVGWDSEHPTGRPALYLPGSSGSFKQARSIASSSTRQLFTSPFVRSAAFPPHTKPLDIFTMDTNEELSAFSAEPLLAQAEYAAYAVRYILSLYSEQPEDVLIIAHSMGGLVARLLLPLLSSGEVRTVVALSTPHAIPPLPISRALEKAYEPSSVPEGVLWLTVCGGTQDTEFPAELCGAWPASAPSSGSSPAAESLDSSSPSSSSSSSSSHQLDQAGNREEGHGAEGVALTRWTTAIPLLWTGVGHREVVWCDQLRSRVARLGLELQAVGAGEGVEGRRKVVEELFGGDDGGGLGLGNVDIGMLTGAVADGEEKRERAREELRPLSTYPASAEEEGGRAARWALMFPLTQPVTPYACPFADQDAPCSPAAVKGRTILPHPPPGEPWPRPSEGVREGEGVVYLELELGRGEELRVFEPQDRGQEGWVAVGGVGEQAVSNVGLLSLLFRPVQIPLPSPSASSLPTLHTHLSLPNLPTHALLVYRATLSFSGDCSFVPPMISTPREGNFHPFAGEEWGWFVSHSSGPFLPLPARHPSTPKDNRSAPGSSAAADDEHLAFDIYAAGPSPSPSTCQITSLHLKLDIRASLSRALPRYRVLLAAWSSGLTALLTLLALQTYDSGLPFPSPCQAYLSFLRRWFLPLAFGLWGLALMPLPEGYLIGTGGMWVVSALAPMLLAVACVLVGVSLVLLWVLAGLLAGVLWLLRIRNRHVSVLHRTCRSRLTRSSSPAATASPGSSPRSRTALLRQYIPLAGLALLLVFFVPSQFVLLVAFLLQLFTTARTRAALFSLPSPASNLTSSASTNGLAARTARLKTHLSQSLHLLLVLLWLLPLTAPTALSWIRTLLARGPQPIQPIERDPLAVLTALVALDHASSGRVFARARSGWQKLIAMGLLAGLAGYAFVCGGRWTYGIYEGVEWYFLAPVLRPAAGEGETLGGEGEKDVDR